MTKAVCRRAHGSKGMRIYHHHNRKAKQLASRVAGVEVENSHLNHKQESERVNWEWHVDLKFQSPLPVIYFLQQGHPFQTGQMRLTTGTQYANAQDYGCISFKAPQSLTKEMPPKIYPNPGCQRLLLWVTNQHIKLPVLQL